MSSTRLYQGHSFNGRSVAISEFDLNVSRAMISKSKLVPSNWHRRFTERCNVWLFPNNYRRSSFLWYESYLPYREKIRKDIKYHGRWKKVYLSNLDKNR